MRQIVQLCLFAPMLSLAFQLRPISRAASNLPKLGAYVSMAANLKPRTGTRNARGTGEFVHRSKANDSGRYHTSLLAAGWSNVHRDAMLRTAGPQVHKSVGMAWLLLFESAVGVILKFYGIALPASVCLVAMIALASPRPQRGRLCRFSHFPSPPCCSIRA